MRATFRMGAAVMAAVASLYAPSHSATITLNPDSTYQTMDGFGFFGGMQVNWCSPKPACIGNNASDPWFQRVIGDLGLTIIRQEYYSAEANQDATWADLVPFHQAMKTKADQLGEPLKFMATYWTPPSSMKSNGSLKNGGNLLPGSYTAFGNWAAQSVQDYANAGIDLYALSLQNEPAFQETYNSCVYTAQTYHDMIAVAGPIVHATHPNVKLLGPETMLQSGNSFIAPTYSDLVTRPQLGVLAYHGYSDGVNPTPNTLMATYWRQAGGLAKNWGINVWMTETSGYAQDWTGAYTLAEAIFSGLKYGRMAGWVMWYGIDNILGNDNTYNAAKSFYRYIRPGAVAIKAGESDTIVHAVAFRHAANQTLTVVILNSSANAQTVQMAGAGLPTQFTRYLSTSTVRCASQGTMTGTASFSAPGKSISVLVATNYAVAVEPGTASASPRAVGGLASAALLRAYTADGRLMRTLSAGESKALRGAAEGMYYLVGYDANGAVVGSRPVAGGF
jgi:glucuronoarabinoxylan endo-1,4-beta-xylanase